jgi:uncharacterized membrane protein
MRHHIMPNPHGEMELVVWYSCPCYLYIYPPQCSNSRRCQYEVHIHHDPSHRYTLRFSLLVLISCISWKLHAAPHHAQSAWGNGARGAQLQQLQVMNLLIDATQMSGKIVHFFSPLSKSPLISCISWKLHAAPHHAQSAWGNGARGVVLMTPGIGQSAG